jgi:hypothetical protein
VQVPEVVDVLLINCLCNIWQTSEKLCDQHCSLYNNFIEFKQASDRVCQKQLWQVLRTYGRSEHPFAKHLVQQPKDMYSKLLSALRVEIDLKDCFRVKVGV